MLAQLIVALKDCHRRARPILHRDIKPANVLLDQDRNIKLADFGLAKELESECGACLRTLLYIVIIIILYT